MLTHFLAVETYVDENCSNEMRENTSAPERINFFIHQVIQFSTLNF